MSNQASQIVPTPAAHRGYEDQFNEGFFRTEPAARYEDGSPAAAAWDAGYEAFRAGRSA